MENIKVSAKKEYFELVKKLNHSNKTKNKDTSVYFYVNKSNPAHLKLFIAISVSQKILLCDFIHLRWKSTQTSGYEHLVEFILSLNINLKSENDITEKIKLALFQLPDESL